MKLGLRLLLAGVLAGALLVPAATANPGKGNGNGPPAWAGGGSGGAKANGKPDWAGTRGQEKKAEKAAERAERRAEREAENAAETPDRDNPASLCRLERERMGAEAFAEEYGANENKANAFGKCVSREAHERDGATPPEDEEPTEPDEGETPAPAPGDDELPAPDGGGETSPTGIAAFASPHGFLQTLLELVI